MKSIFVGLLVHHVYLQNSPMQYSGTTCILPQVDAFSSGLVQKQSKPLHHVMMSTSPPSVADINHNEEETTNNLAQTTSEISRSDENSSLHYTTAILKIAYDGTHFCGWTGGNAGHETNPKTKVKSKRPQGHNKNTSSQQSQKRKQSRRSRTLQRRGGGWYESNNNVRTVDHTIRMALAKIFGNVDPKNIIFEGCSRTDAGVHATSLVAQFYCYNDQRNTSSGDSTLNRSSNSSLPLFRPSGPTDATNFIELPFNSDLSKLVFVLNRMLPPDVRILAASPMPTVKLTSPSLTKCSIDAFHPTLCTDNKTYVYRFAIGTIQDPLQSRFVWHLDGSSGRAMGMNGRKFDLDRAIQAVKLFACANPRDYAAFGSVMRGNEKDKTRSTICTILRCDLVQEETELLPSWEQHRSSDATNNNVAVRYGSRLNMAGAPIHPDGIDTSPQTFAITITGDRFVYKMVRNIVGAIVAVACGHNELEDIQEALSTGVWGNGPSGSRRICAPGRGLKLVDVNYSNDIRFDWHSG